MASRVVEHLKESLKRAREHSTKIKHALMHGAKGKAMTIGGGAVVAVAEESLRSISFFKNEKDAQGNQVGGPYRVPLALAVAGWLYEPKHHDVGVMALTLAGYIGYQEYKKNNASTKGFEDNDAGALVDPQRPAGSLVQPGAQMPAGALDQPVFSPPRMAGAGAIDEVNEYQY